MTLDRIIRRAKADTALALADLTVLSKQLDPYRLTGDMDHENSRWLVNLIKRLHIRTPIHARGLHYAIFMAPGGTVKPNGEPYTNTDEDWEWLQAYVIAPARWLGHLPWEAISDKRNDPPIFRRSPARATPAVKVWFDIDVEIPDDIEPTVYVGDFAAAQPYQLMLVGEKSSLEQILGPIAAFYDASLCLPTGQMSTTMAHSIAHYISLDPRPARIFYFSDFDPEGYGMSIGVARKLQALHDAYFPEIELEVQHIALTARQVQEYGLPNTPMKTPKRDASAQSWRAFETKRRKWVDAWGQEQTEIDALAALQPDVLRALAVDAILPYYDETLSQRCFVAHAEFDDRAQDAFKSAYDQEQIGWLRARAGVVLDAIRGQIDALNEEMAEAVPYEALDIEAPEVPTPRVTGEPADGAEIVFTTDDDYLDATERMRQRQRYDV